MRLYLLLPFFLLSVVCYSQDRKYFTEFKPTAKVYGWPTWGCYYFTGKYHDSLAIELDIIKDTIADGMEYVSFELKHSKDKLVFWIGVKDSVIYTFKDNKLNKPVKVFDFNNKVAETKSVSLFPFTKTTNLSVRKSVYEEDVCEFIPEKEIMLGKLRLDNFSVSLRHGFIFMLTDAERQLGYSNYDEIDWDE
ncbi:MAG: hypothetical protein ACO1N9_13085 [Flavobacterium sp.]